MDNNNNMDQLTNFLYSQIQKGNILPYPPNINIHSLSTFSNYYHSGPRNPYVQAQNAGIPLPEYFFNQNLMGNYPGMGAVRPMNAMNAVPSAFTPNLGYAESVNKGFNAFVDRKRKPESPAVQPEELGNMMTKHNELMSEQNQLFSGFYQKNDSKKTVTDNKQFVGSNSNKNERVKISKPIFAKIEGNKNNSKQELNVMTKNKANQGLEQMNTPSAAALKMNCNASSNTSGPSSNNNTNLSININNGLNNIDNHNHIHDNINNKDNNKDNNSIKPKYFKCDFPHCEKVFSKECNLRDHSRIHTGDKPYKCSFPKCDRSFSQNGNLKKHEKVHSGFKKFSCDFAGCGKKFSASYNLKVIKIFLNFFLDSLSLSYWREAL